MDSNSLHRSGLFSYPCPKNCTASLSTVLVFKPSIDLGQSVEGGEMINRPAKICLERFGLGIWKWIPAYTIFWRRIQGGAKFGTGSAGCVPSGWAITWLNSYRMRKTVVCSVKTITKPGWNASTTAWQVWCRAAARARSGMTRVSANSLKNQPSAIDACIILKPSADTVTARRPRESSGVPTVPMQIRFSALYPSAKSLLS